MNLNSQLSVLRRYYDRRAPEYEDIYNRSDRARRDELQCAAETMKRGLEGRNVLEIACGTGYWTRRLAGRARAVVAVDASREMLSIARDRSPRGAAVEYLLADAYDLQDLAGKFDAGLAGFWLSHVPKAMMSVFLAGFHSRLETGAVVFMIDNFRRPGRGGEFIRVAGSEDTFRRRELSDGSNHEIIKNYYDVEELERLLAPLCECLEVSSGAYYWWLTYRVA
ncbi:MAG: class I SAM-dependent methyltransferase [Candidatus Krumholzibacteriia bacterium]